MVPVGGVVASADVTEAVNCTVSVRLKLDGSAVKVVVEGVASLVHSEIKCHASTEPSPVVRS